MKFDCNQNRFTTICMNFWVSTTFSTSSTQKMRLGEVERLTYSALNTKHESLEKIEFTPITFNAPKNAPLRSHHVRNLAHGALTKKIEQPLKLCTFFLKQNGNQYLRVMMSDPKNRFVCTGWLHGCDVPDSKWSPSRA